MGGYSVSLASVMLGITRLPSISQHMGPARRQRGAAAGPSIHTLLTGMCALPCYGPQRCTDCWTTNSALCVLDDKQRTLCAGLRTPKRKGGSASRPDPDVPPTAMPFAHAYSPAFLPSCLLHMPGRASGAGSRLAGGAQHHCGVHTRSDFCALDGCGGSESCPLWAWRVVVICILGHHRPLHGHFN